MAALAALDVLTRFRDALSRLGQNVHETNTFHFFRSVDPPRQHHLFGEGRPETAGYKTVGSHARNRPKMFSGKSEFRAALGDDDVEGEQRFKTATERIALRYTDRNHRQTKAINVPMQDTHARFAVSDECLAIARADPCGEMIEVATKIEHAGSTRTEQQA